ncbi:hypothetical protein F5X98DRAFT_389599 [Xylaria grammica]|nr:hypothetical protein F5X98DRAFT_389599 [Xylaria grammica]
MPPRRQCKPDKVNSSRDTHQVDENSEEKGIDRLAPISTALGTPSGIPTFSAADFHALSLRLVDNSGAARSKYDDWCRVSEYDFLALNPNLPDDDRLSNAYRDTNRIVVATVGNSTVLMHAKILARSRVLYNLFNTETGRGLLNCANFIGIGPREFQLFAHSLYCVDRGRPSPVLSFNGVDYIKALCLSNTFCCQREVYDFIADCTGSYFNALDSWRTLFDPPRLTTLVSHEKRILEINEAYKVYKEHVCSDGPRAFTDNSFAIFLLKFCPAAVYDAHSAKLDQSLVREVGNVALRQRDADAFSQEETRLFTKPDSSNK